MTFWNSALLGVYVGMLAIFELIARPNEFAARGASPAPRNATKPPRPGSLLNRARGDKCSKQGKPSQANSWSEDLGRLVLTWAAKRGATGTSALAGVGQQMAISTAIYKY